MLVCGTRDHGHRKNRRQINPCVGYPVFYLVLLSYNLHVTQRRQQQQLLLLLPLLFYSHHTGQPASAGTSS